MTDEKGRYKDPTAVLKEIEEEIERLKSGRREQIEKKLQEKILQHRKEAADEISRVEQEYERGREEFKKYETVIAEYDRVRLELQERIQEHLGRVEQCRAEVAKAALAAATSLREVDRQNKKFRDLRRAVEERASLLQGEIAEKFHMNVELPERQDADELKVDVNAETDWFQKIINDLEAKPALPLARPVPSAPPRPPVFAESKPEAPPPRPGAPKPAPGAAPAIAPVVRFPELQDLVDAPESSQAGTAKNEVRKPAPSAAAAPLAPPTPPPAPRPARTASSAQAAPPPGSGGEHVLKALKQYMRFDPTDHAGEMRFFQKDDKVILDGEFIVGSLGESLEATRSLYEKIGRTRSSKDQFFIKQEIVNRQEALRKVILRGVRMCEKEDCQLPAFTLDIMNLAILKNILEMLNVGNWSTEEDFRYFCRYADRVKTAYTTRITPPAVYYAAVLSELES
jgi:hypothetical protein